MEKSLIVICILAAIAIVALVVSLSIAVVKKNECESHLNQQVKVCSTPGCVQTASQILYKMDETVEPCDDFYNFACGNFVKETIIPDEKSRVTQFSIIEDKLQEQLRVLVNEKVDANDSASFNVVRKLYNACMNTKEIERQGLKPMFEIMEQLGRWPTIKEDKWDINSQWSWIWSVQKLHKLGYPSDYVFKFFIDVDSKNSITRSIYVSFNIDFVLFIRFFLNCGICSFILH